MTQRLKRVCEFSIYAVAGIALVLVLLLVGASGCVCMTRANFRANMDVARTLGRTEGDPWALRAARAAAQDASPVPSTRAGVYIISEVHEMFTLFDTVRVTNWIAYPDGRWYVLLSSGDERWSDKAPRRVAR